MIVTIQTNPTILLASALLLTLMSGDSTAQQVGKPTSRPDPIDAVDDPVNQMAQTYVTALRVTLEIRGTDVAVHSTELIKVRARDVRKPADPNDIVVNAVVDTDKVVGRGSNPDDRFNVREGSGTVIKESRRVSVAIPIIALPNEILVALPNEPEPVRRLPLPDDFSSYCSDFPDDPICSGNAVERHPLYRILNPLPP